MALKKISTPHPPPTSLKYFEILPCLLHTFLAVIRAFIKQGNKIKIFSLFFTPVPLLSSLFPNVFFFFPFPPFFPLNFSCF